MPLPTCPKCPNTTFEMSPFEALGGHWKYQAIHCSGCGAIVAVMEDINVGSMLREQNAAIERIAQRVGVPVRVTTK
jgi:hypothetical protein